MSASLKQNKYNVDIAIFGGGIAGLWCLSRLKKEGYNTILIEKDSLGCGQTLASQGMIHGGQKYTLTGKASSHAHNVAKMPKIWDDCFSGNGDIDLSNTKVLSDHQIMWTTGKLSEQAGIFAASKVVNAKTEKLNELNYSSLFQYIDFKGSIYKMAETVVDTKSLLEELSKPYDDSIYQGEILKIEADAKRNINSLMICDDNNCEVEITAQSYIFTAGKGNESILKELGHTQDKTLTQRRPLKQVMARTRIDSINGHCVSLSPKPRVTLTSHPDNNGNYIWYMGANIAENAVNQSNDEAMISAHNEMKSIFPWLKWDNIQWACWPIDRAEPYDADGHLPPGPHIKSFGNTIFGWPTKLTFAPALAEDLMNAIKNKVSISKKETRLPLKKAMIGQYPWEIAKWSSLPEALETDERQYAS